MSPHDDGPGRTLPRRRPVRGRRDSPRAASRATRCTTCSTRSSRSRASSTCPRCSTASCRSAPSSPARATARSTSSTTAGTSTTFVYTGVPTAVARMMGHAPHAFGVLGQIPAEGALRLDGPARPPRVPRLPADHPPMGSFLGASVRVGDAGVRPALPVGEGGRVHRGRRADGDRARRRGRRRRRERPAVRRGRAPRALAARRAGHRDDAARGHRRGGGARAHRRDRPGRRRGRHGRTRAARRRRTAVHRARRRARRRPAGRRARCPRAAVPGP